MLISQKPEYTRKIEEDRLSPFSNDEVLLNLADKKLSNVDIYTTNTYYNYVIVLNSKIERALASESPRLQPAVQRICELSSLVGKARDIRVANEEQTSLGAFAKALLARRAADLILVHHATSSLNTKSSSEWKVCVSALCRLALYWLAACKHTTRATSALVALEALEANSIRKHLSIDEDRVERLLHNAECAEKLGDACGAACPSATSSPSRSGHSFTPTLISFVPLGGFESCIQEAAEKDVPPPLTEDKYNKCIGALAGTLENPMVLRRLVNVMRVDSAVASGSFIDTLFPSLPAYPSENFKGLFNAELSRFDLKSYLLFLTGWTRVSLSTPLSAITGASRLLSPAPLPTSIFTSHQTNLWSALVLRAQKRYTGLTEHALSVQGVKKVTRLMTAPPVPLMGTLFYTIRDDHTGVYVTELYAKKIVETICCSDPSADRAIFRSPQGGIIFDSDDETRLLNDASIFISSCEMSREDWLGAERTLLMCEEDEKIVDQLVEVYSAWLNDVTAKGSATGGIEKKLKDMKTKQLKYSSSSRSDKENEDREKGRKTGGSSSSSKGINENGWKTRSPAISIDGDDANRSFASTSEYTSAPSTPFKNGTIFGAESPVFHTPGGRPSLWPGAVQRNLFIQATQNASSTPKSSLSVPPQFREEEVQTDSDDVFTTEMYPSVSTEPSVSMMNLNETSVSMSRERRSSDGVLPEDQFELESLLTSLNLINDGFAERTKAKVDLLEKAHEEEREEERRRKEEEEKERREADEEIRRLNEKMQQKRLMMTPKTAKTVVFASPSIPSTPFTTQIGMSGVSGHRPLGATPTVDALPDVNIPSSVARLLPQQQLLQSYLQQPLIAASAASPSTMGSAVRQQLLSAVSGPSSVQSPGVHRMGETGMWMAPRPLFPSTTCTTTATTVPSPLQSMQMMLQSRGMEEQTQVETVAAAKSLSAFETAFMKKKEEEKGEKEDKEGPHKGCICCHSDEQQDRWFAAYNRVMERNDRMNE